MTWCSFKYLLFQLSTMWTPLIRRDVNRVCRSVVLSDLNSVKARPFSKSTFRIWRQTLLRVQSDRNYLETKCSKNWLPDVQRTSVTLCVQTQRLLCDPSVHQQSTRRCWSDMAGGRYQGPVSCRRPSDPLPPLCSENQTAADDLKVKETMQ